MASDREKAKKSVVKIDSSDPELDNALENAVEFQLELKKEENRHKEATNSQQLGFFGRLLGGEKSAPVAIAFITTLVGLAAFIGCLIASSQFEDPGIIAFWSTQSERALGLAMAALAYIFGKGSR